MYLCFAIVCHLIDLFPDYFATFVSLAYRPFAAILQHLELHLASECATTFPAVADNAVSAALKLVVRSTASASAAAALASASAASSSSSALVIPNRATLLFALIARLPLRSDAAENAACANALVALIEAQDADLLGGMMMQVPRVAELLFSHAIALTSTTSHGNADKEVDDSALGGENASAAVFSSSTAAASAPASASSASAGAFTFTFSGGPFSMGSSSSSSSSSAAVVSAPTCADGWRFERRVAAALRALPDREAVARALAFAPAVAVHAARRAQLL
jgi:hypothetical protein